MEVVYNLQLLKEGYMLDDISMPHDLTQILYESDNINNSFIESLKKILKWLMDRVRDLSSWIRKVFRKKIEEDLQIADELKSEEEKYFNQRGDIKYLKSGPVIPKVSITIYDKLINMEIDIVEHIKNISSTIEKITYNLTENPEAEYPDWLPEEAFKSANNLVNTIARKFLNHQEKITDYQKVIGNYLLGQKVTMEIDINHRIVTNAKLSLMRIETAYETIDKELTALRQLMEVLSGKLKLMDNLKGIIQTGNSEKLRRNYANSVKLYSATITLLEKYMKTLSTAESNISQVLKTIASKQKNKKQS